MTDMEYSAHADAQYKDVAAPTHATYTDALARANAAHTSKTNSLLHEVNVTSTVHPWGTVETYSGGNIVAYADNTPQTTVEGFVRTAIGADALFSTGPNTASPVDGDASAYFDPLYLIEAAKLTGEKFY
jgi:hypothetical protein